MTTNLSKNIEKRLKYLSMSQRQLALAAGIKPATINNIIHGKAQRSAHIVEIAQALQCTAEDLLLKQAVGDETFANKIAKVYETPILNSQLEEIKDKFALCPMRCSVETFAMIADEIAMEPKINKGDTVFIDRAKTPTDMSLVVARIDGRGVIRRLVFNRDDAYLEALNPKIAIANVKINLQKDLIGVIICSVINHIVK